METVKQTLEQRGEVYGDYAGSVSVRAGIMDIIKARYEAVNNTYMSEQDQVRIYDIVNKISRLAVSPKHKDSWHDIVGYASLIEEALDEQD